MRALYLALLRVWVWLASWLAPQPRFSDASLLDAALECTLVSGGLVGEVKRVALAKPVVIKRSRNRLHTLRNGQGREVDFYLWSRAPVELLPRIYAAKQSLFGDVAIAMEDLTARGGERLGLYLFNQCDIWGPAAAARMHQVPPQAVLQSLFEHVAHVHRRFWNDASLKSVRWLKCVEWTHGRGRATWEANLAFTKKAWVHATHVRTQLDADLVRRIDASLQASTWEAFQSSAAREPFSLAHGDFHAGNIMLVEGKSFAVLDWSEVHVGNPVHDLGQLLISDVTPVFVKRHAKALVQAYHRALDVDDVTADECWRWVLDGGGGRWVQLFCLLASMDAVPDKAVAYFGKNLLAWMHVADDEFDDIIHVFRIGMMAIMT